jgi:hypothetical protein
MAAFRMGVLYFCRYSATEPSAKIATDFQGDAIRNLRRRAW